MGPQTFHINAVNQSLINNIYWMSKEFCLIILHFAAGLMNWYLLSLLSAPPPHASLWLPPCGRSRQDMQPDHRPVPLQGRCHGHHMQPLRQRVPAEPLARGPLHQWVTQTHIHTQLPATACNTDQIVMVHFISLPVTIKIWQKAWSIAKGSTYPNHEEYRT